VTEYGKLRALKLSQEKLIFPARFSAGVRLFFKDIFTIHFAATNRNEYQKH
jgi:hypothetical protein